MNTDQKVKHQRNLHLQNQSQDHHLPEENHHQLHGEEKRTERVEKVSVINIVK